MTLTPLTLQATVRRFCQAIDAQDWATAKELTTPNCRARAGGHDLDREAWLGMGQMFAAAFPDGKHEIQDLICEGDRAVVRGTWHGTHQGAFQGIPATGRAVTIDMVMIERVVDGRIVEHFAFFDAMALMQQLGVMPGA